MRTLILLAVTSVLPGCATYNVDEQASSGAVDTRSENANAEMIYIIDGRVSTRADFERLSSNEIAKIDVLKGQAAVARFGVTARSGAILITTRTSSQEAENRVLNKLPDQMLYFVNGNRTSVAEVRRLSTSSIESIEIVKGKAAVARYGPEARDGAILVSTKR